MIVVRPKDFQGAIAWQAIPIANMNGITTRLHWTDSAYGWHVNDGDEVFVVLDGIVDMHYRGQDGELQVRLHPGDIFYANTGMEHSARPQGEARVLVVEREGSI